VFIAFVKGETNVGGVNRFAIARHILGQAAGGKLLAYTSTLTLAEAHKLRTGPTLSSEDDERLLRFFENDYFQFVAVDRTIGEQANRLCRRYGLLPNDAIHLACALRADCDVLLAWDNRFARVTGQPIRIEEPQIIGQAELPDLPPP
jgi:predicted nucleic acid-binding protein